MKNRKFLENDRLIKLVFRALMVLTILTSLIQLVVLPREDDGLFAKGETKSVVCEEDILYKGSFDWVKEDGERVSDISYGKYRVEAGHVFAAESIIPADFDEGAIIIRASQQNLRIYIDGVLRVNYDTKDSRPYGSQTTSRYVICDTDDSDAGALLRIETVSDNAEYSGVFNSVYACDKYDFWSFIGRQYSSSFFFGMVVILLGIFTVLISFIISKVYKEEMELEFIGWCVFLAGCWLMGESKLRQILVSNNSVISNICFIVVMLAPISLLIFINGIQKGRYAGMYRVFNCLALANFFVSMLLQIFDVADFLDTLPLAHFVLIITIIAVAATFVLDWRKKYINEYRTIFIGLMVLMTCVAVEVISTYFVTMLPGFTLMVGILVFVAMAVIKSANDIRNKRIKQQEDRIIEEREKNESMSMQMIQNLSSTLEAKDEYKGGHSYRVSLYSEIIAQIMGLDKKTVADIKYAASLHDIGKISVPDTILNKPTTLSDEEYNLIKSHTTIGAEILSSVELISYTADIARHHHERYDGKGYPDGLTGEDISLGARIVAAADAFDAMNSRRIYRNPLSKEAIMNEFAKNRGLQFDPNITDILLEALEQGAFDIGRANGFVDDESNAKRDKYDGVDEAGKILTMIMETMHKRPSGDDVDYLTGLPMRGKGEEQIASLMKTSPGALIFFDMDNLKKINDVHGHRAGDKALCCIGKALSAVAGDGVVCRIGGDEFLLFVREKDENLVSDKVREVLELFGKSKDTDVLIKEASLSAGICMCTPGDNYADVLAKADKALYYVKHRGKDGYYFYREDSEHLNGSGSAIDIEKLMSAIRRAGNYSGAMDIEYREFAKMYEYIGNLCERYKHTCHLSLVTMDIKSGENAYIDEIEQAMNALETAIRDNIRNVDVCTRYSSVQYLVILLEAGEQNVDTIMERIFNNFHKLCGSEKFVPHHESRTMMDV